jgi:hypothetical protein
MNRSGEFTLQVLLANSGALASAAIPGFAQILFSDIGKRGKTLEHTMSWCLESFMDCDLSVTARTSGQTDSSEIRSDMLAAGMTEVGQPPSDEELRLYYSFHAPAHQAIRENRFAEAAVFYRWLAIGASDPAMYDRYTVAARQLHIAQEIKTVCHREVSFPPKGIEIEDYFRALAQLPVREIQVAFQEYVDAFFIKPVGLTNFCSSQPADAQPQEEWCTQIPVGWEDIQCGKLRHDSRRLLDAVAFVLLGQKCLKAAGFSTGQFAVGSNQSRAPQQRPLSTIMFTTKRAFLETRRGAAGIHTEVVVVANGSMQWTVAREFVEIEAAEELLLWSAFQTALGVSMDQSGRMHQERIVRHEDLAKARSAS